MIDMEGTTYKAFEMSNLFTTSPIALIGFMLFFVSCGDLGYRIYHGFSIGVHVAAFCSNSLCSLLALFCDLVFIGKSVQTMTSLHGLSSLQDSQTDDTSS
jgi:hypothetical protein